MYFDIYSIKTYKCLHLLKLSYSQIKGTMALGSARNISVIRNIFLNLLIHRVNDFFDMRFFTNITMKF